MRRALVAAEPREHFVLHVTEHVVEPFNSRQTSRSESQVRRFALLSHVVHLDSFEQATSEIVIEWTKTN
jgi:hypothetical protein